MWVQEHSMATLSFRNTRWMSVRCHGKLCRHWVCYQFFYQYICDLKKRSLKLFFIMIHIFYHPYLFLPIPNVKKTNIVYPWPSFKLHDGISVCLIEIKILLWNPSSRAPIEIENWKKVQYFKKIRFFWSWTYANCLHTWQILWWNNDFSGMCKEDKISGQKISFQSIDFLFFAQRRKNVIHEIYYVDNLYMYTTKKS